VINGETTFDFAGSAVDGAGDVNGDGLADIIVGAYGSDIAGDTAGRAYVVFGKASATPVDLQEGRQLASAASPSTASCPSTSPVRPSRALATSTVTASPTFIVGAPLADANSKDAGRSYLVFGKANTDLVKLADVSLGTGGLTITASRCATTPASPSTLPATSTATATTTSSSAPTAPTRAATPPAAATSSSAKRTASPGPSASR
jgi:hypothetical protein